jgi:hypothetical protein
MTPFEETRAALIGREGEVLAALGITPPHRGHIRCVLPSHEDRNASWRFVFRTGRWFCTCTPRGGDIFDLVIAMGRAHDAMSAMAFVREVLGLPPVGQRRELTPQERAAWANQQAELRAADEERRRQRDAEHAEYAKAQRIKGLRAWLRRTTAIGTLAQAYLSCRGIFCPLPGTLGFLAPLGPDQHPAMIAAFGIPDEPEPGKLLLPPARLRGILLTFLRGDGRGKAQNRHGACKITLGIGHNAPIVLAAPNDLGGLLIAEGIEDALTGHQQTGLGAWAAGTANRLPGLAEHVPDWIEAVTIIEDDNRAGRDGCEQLAKALCARGKETRIERGNGLRDAAA